MKILKGPKVLKIIAVAIGISLIGFGYLVYFGKDDGSIAAKSSSLPHLSNLPLTIDNNADITLNVDQLTIYTKDRWCETGPLLFGVGLSWDDLIEALLVHLGSIHENVERELTIYFLGVTSEEGVKMAAFITSEADALGYKLIGKELLDYRINDFYKPLRTVLATHPDALIVFNPYQTGDHLLEQIAKLQLTSDMTVATFSEAIDRETIERLGKGLEGLKIAGGKDKGVIVDAIKAALNSFLAGTPDNPKPTTPQALANHLLSMRIPSPFGELNFAPDNFLLEQPIDILRWDGEKMVLAEDSGFARHRGSCPQPKAADDKNKDKDD